MARSFSHRFHPCSQPSFSFTLSRCVSPSSTPSCLPPPRILLLLLFLLLCPFIPPTNDASQPPTDSSANSVSELQDCSSFPLFPPRVLPVSRASRTSSPRYRTAESAVVTYVVLSVDVKRQSGGAQTSSQTNFWGVATPPRGPSNFLRACDSDTTFTKAFDSDNSSVLTLPLPLLSRVDGIRGWKVVGVVNDG